MQAIPTTAGRRQTTVEIGKNNFLVVTWLQIAERLALKRSMRNHVTGYTGYKSGTQLHKPQTRMACAFTPVIAKAQGLRIGYLQRVGYLHNQHDSTTDIASHAPMHRWQYATFDLDLDLDLRPSTFRHHTTISASTAARCMRMYSTPGKYRGPCVNTSTQGDAERHVKTVFYPLKRDHSFLKEIK